MQVHTGVTTSYAVSVLSRFTNDPGPRHIKYLKQLILYLIGTVDDRLIFRKVPMTAARPNAIPQLQASYMMDADLAGQDKYSQESFIALWGGDITNHGSHKQSTMSYGTYESELKTVCNFTKSEVVSNHKIYNAMGFLQLPAKIHEDNSAVVTVSKTQHLSKAGRHLPLWLSWVQELVHDGIIEIVHIRSESNFADIGTKYLPKDVFTRIEAQLVDKEISKRNNPRLFR